MGGDSVSARNAGIPTDRLTIALFMSSGLGAAFVGMSQAILYNSAQVAAGQSFIFNSIIAVVIGGVLLTGGYGSVVGIVLGTLTFSIVNQGIYYTGFDANWASLIIGVLLLARRADEQHVPQHGAVLRSPHESEGPLMTHALAQADRHQQVVRSDRRPPRHLARGQPRARCCACSATTAPASRRSSRSSPASTSRRRAEWRWTARPVEFNSPRDASDQGHRDRPPVRRHVPADEHRTLLLRRGRADAALGPAQHLRPQARQRNRRQRDARNSASRASTTAIAWSAACPAASARRWRLLAPCISAPAC